MRLGEFIVRDMEVIIARWEAFAATRLPAAGKMASLELRDHAQQILEAVVADLATAQTPEAQSAKSQGLAHAPIDAPETAAQTHAVLRAKSDFDIEQLASEYRALRTSVLTAWMEACLPNSPFIDDVIRFNEAIDQALAESIAFFTAHVNRSRNLLVGMLSHDLRSPLQTIKMTAEFLRRIDTSAEVGEAAERLVYSGARMQQLLDDLVDVNRTEIGLGISVTPEDLDLGGLCADELDQIRTAHPGRRVNLDVVGDCRGSWDAGRLQQLLNNIVVNAILYGDDDGTTQVDVHGAAREVCMTVTNRGPTVDHETLAQIFEPLKRGPGQARKHGAGLGLGLFIASEIAKAHGGTITATSAEGRTAFAVHLPRSVQAAA